MFGLQQLCYYSPFRGRYSEVAPPHSHLNVEDFPSPKALAEHLLYLDQNPTAYLSYFWWKDHLRSRSIMTEKHQSMCDLCRLLNDPSAPPKVVEDLEDWWWVGGRCVDKGRAPWSNTRLSDSWLGRAVGGILGSENVI